MGRPQDGPADEGGEEGGEEPATTEAATQGEGEGDEELNEDDDLAGKCCGPLFPLSAAAPSSNVGFMGSRPLLCWMGRATQS